MAACTCGSRLRPLGSRGFTLIELIVVLVVLAILATTSVAFVVRVVDSYRSTQERALLVNTARSALERMTRQLRGALPYSVRVINDGACLQFMPIAGGGNYIFPVPDQANAAAPSAVIGVSSHAIEFGSASFVSIGALSPVELYGANAGSRTGYGAGSSTTQLQLVPAKQWLRNSIRKRFYLLSNPQAFCLVGDELRFYEGLDVNDNVINVDQAHGLMARGVSSSGAPFELKTGTENRNAGVVISLIFSRRGESLSFIQEAMIRNVP